MTARDLQQVSMRIADRAARTYRARRRQALRFMFPHCAFTGAKLRHLAGALAAYGLPRCRHCGTRIEAARGTFRINGVTVSATGPSCYGCVTPRDVQQLLALLDMATRDGGRADA